MPAKPEFIDEQFAYLIIDGSMQYLDSPRKTISPSDLITLAGIMCYNYGDSGDIYIGVYAYDGTNFHQVAGGSKRLNYMEFMTEADLDRSEFHAGELCMFNKDIEIVVISYYWDGSSWKQSDWLCYNSNCGFKLRVETKCCDWLCTSRAKVFKVKVLDYETNEPIEGATVELCFDCGFNCRSTSPGYESHKTDKNGEVWIEKCGPGMFDPGCITIKASKSGYTPCTPGGVLCSEWSLVKDCDTYTLYLETIKYIDMTITVLDSVTNQPVENAKVELREGWYPYNLIETKYTDSYGKVTFKNLDSYLYYRVYITKDGYKFYDSGSIPPVNKTFKIKRKEGCNEGVIVKVRDVPEEGLTVQAAPLVINACGWLTTVNKTVTPDNPTAVFDDLRHALLMPYDKWCFRVLNSGGHTMSVRTEDNAVEIPSKGCATITMYGYLGCRYRTRITVNPPSPTVNQPFELRATLIINPGSLASENMEVEFFKVVDNKEIPLGKNLTNSEGVAVLVHSENKPGTYKYLARYTGADTFAEVKTVVVREREFICPILMATQGTIVFTKLDTLRYFRDNYMPKSLVKTYYSLAPFVSPIVERSRIVSFIIRELTRILIETIERSGIKCRI